MQIPISFILANILSYNAILGEENKHLVVQKRNSLDSSSAIDFNARNVITAVFNV